jgi:hypothetical protein
MEGRKQAISIRLNAADLRNLRKLARRLGVRHSDVIRLAIKSTVARLGPLLEADVHGKDLLPVFVESGSDLVRYLDLDVTSLDAIINAEAPEANRVERADVRLMASLGAQQPFLRLRLAGVRNGQNGSLELDTNGEDQLLNQTLRRYLYDKYMFEQPSLAGTPAVSAGGQLP